MGKRDIYIVLTDTGTMLTKLIKLYTGAPYNHVSIAFDLELKQMYSFGRKRPNNPLIGGFVREEVNQGIYRNRKIKCAVYTCKVRNTHYKQMITIIGHFEKNKHAYKYNFLGLFGFLFNRGIERKHAYFCSQFVATILKHCRVRVVDKQPSLTTPQDFSQSPACTLVYEGELSDYLKKYSVDEYLIKAQAAEQS